MNATLLVLLAVVVLAIVLFVIWRTGFARDLVHGAQMIERGGEPPDLATQTSGGQSIDPVCGMVVSPDEGVELEHEGRTVRFCSANCRRRFESSPESYGAKVQGRDSVGPGPTGAS